jgi:hypothetical protein
VLVGSGRDFAFAIALDSSSVKVDIWRAENFRTVLMEDKQYPVTTPSDKTISTGSEKFNKLISPPEKSMINMK